MQGRWWAYPRERDCMKPKCKENNKVDHKYTKRGRGGRSSGSRLGQAEGCCWQGTELQPYCVLSLSLQWQWRMVL